MATVHFYQANYVKKKTKIITREGGNKNKTEVISEELSYDELKNELKKIIKSNEKNNCIEILKEPDWSMLEILGYGKNIGSRTECDSIDEADYIFARLGRKKDINNIHRRNMKDFSSQEIVVNQDEEVEIFTYLFLFFEETVQKVSIAYLTSLSAPNIRQLTDMVRRYTTDKTKELEISPILTKEVTSILRKKDIVNAIQYKIAVPSDKILGLDGLGLPEKVYDELENVKSTDIVITISAERNKNLFKDKSVIEELKNHIYSTHKDKVKECLAKAKNNETGQSMLVYHFLDNEFISKIKIDLTSGNGDERVEEISNKMYNEYNNKRNELFEYMK